MWDWVCRIGMNIYFLANSFETYDYVVFLGFVPYNIENFSNFIRKMLVL